MPGWKHIRIFLLVSVLAGVGLVFTKTFLYANSVEKKSVETVALPGEVPLSGWQSTGNQPLADQTPEWPNYLAGRKYSYIQDSDTLDIEARYIVGTNGDVRKFISDYTDLSQPIEQLNLETRYQNGVGSYLIFADQGKMHLSSCVNPYGGSTVTIRDYQWNRNFRDVRYRLIPWLFGESLKDERCLWTHAEIDLDGRALDEATALVESAWLPWSQWWASYLPTIKSQQ